MKNQIDSQQQSLMLHAIGKELDKDKQCRNYFYTYSNDPNWEDLILKGYAERRDIKNLNKGIDCVYFVTTKGLEKLKEVLKR